MGFPVAWTEWLFVHCFQVEFWFLEFLVIVEWGNSEYPEKNTRSRKKNQQQTKPMYGVNSGNQTCATVVGDKGSPHCTIPAIKN